MTTKWLGPSRHRWQTSNWLIHTSPLPALSASLTSKRTAQKGPALGKIGKNISILFWEQFGTSGNFMLCKRNILEMTTYPIYPGQRSRVPACPGSTGEKGSSGVRTKPLCPSQVCASHLDLATVKFPLHGDWYAARVFSDEGVRNVRIRGGPGPFRDHLMTSSTQQEVDEP